MSDFNLSHWALEHKSFVVYLMLIIALAGILQYYKLGREEDPPFTIKTMVVKTLWPGATTLETVQQVTDRIEKKLEELPNLDYLKSYSKPGESVVFVNLKDTTRAADVPDLWYQVRKKIGDIKQTLPREVLGPFFNDEFGDTYSLVFALTGDGFGHRELRDYAERVRAELLGVPDASKIDLLGTQDEKIYLEFSTQQLAAMGLDVSQLVQTLQAQNAIQPSGTLDAEAEKIAVRVSGQFTSEESLQAVNFRVNGQFFRLSDIARIRRGYVDPQQPMFRYNGTPAIGLAISMTKNADVLAFGEHIKQRLAKLTADLPVGIETHLVADQPEVVEEAVGEFIKTLIEAIVIVLAVSFLALGWRPGIVVAIAIPLVLAITFVVMKLAGISLQRISLGALIIGLGLLVDDAMIAVETMITKLEEGSDKIAAATFAYTSTAFPMLTGTLVTIAGFVPVGFAASSAGEYCFTLFARGCDRADRLLGRRGAVHAADRRVHPARPAEGAWSRAIRDGTAVHARARSRAAHALCGDRRHGRAVRRGARRHAVRAAAVLSQLRPPRAARRPHAAAGLLDQRDAQDRRRPRENSQDRPRHRALVVLCRQRRHPLLPAARPAAGQRLLRPGGRRHQGLQGPPGRAAAHPRGFARAGVRAGARAREPARARAAGRLAAQVPHQRSGPDEGPRTGAELCVRARQQPERPKHQFRLERALEGGSRRGRPGPCARARHQLASVEPDHQRGALGHHRDAGARRHLLIDVVARAVGEERAKLETLRSLRIATPGGRAVPLEQMAKLSYALEPPLIWRRQRLPTVTVQADTAPGVEAATVVKALGPELAAFKAKLPPGYDAVVGGTVEDSAKAQASVFAVFPLMLFIMITILMVQLQSFQRLFLVIATAPLALIGVAAALLLSGAPMGFVAILGVVSLIGMVIRNSVILIDQIETEIAHGRHPWNAVIGATQHRLRPILLTAAAAILGMIPIAPTVFWGPMAYAVMGGLVIATLLTLVFLPALYVAWFRIQPAEAMDTAHAETADGVRDDVGGLNPASA